MNRVHDEQLRSKGDNDGRQALAQMDALTYMERRFIAEAHADFAKTRGWRDYIGSHKNEILDA